MELCSNMWSHRKRFLCLAVTICKGSSCLPPKRRVLPSPASYLPPPPGGLITAVVMWGNAGSCGYRPLRPEQGCCSGHRALSLALVLRCRRECRGFLTCAIADAVVLGSEAFSFFHSLRNLSFFLSSLGIS